MATHSITPRTYYLVFALLVLLTVLTVGISFLELGVMHTVVGLAIATVKGVLVALFFMHLWTSGKLTWLVLVASLFWLGILFVLTLSDYLTRWWLAY
jgi:cytochrome c oxidase subunit IV